MIRRMRGFLTTAIFLVLAVPFVALAHGDTAAEVEVGRGLDQSLQSGTKKCADLTDEDFEALGEFSMDRMMGQAHTSMNETMEQMMGEPGTDQLHITMGKRMSGCDASAQMPVEMASGMTGMMNMMSMMSGMGGGGMTGSGTAATGMMAARNFGGMMGGLYPTSFSTVWYVTGILGAVLLLLIVIKYIRELLK